MSFPQPLVVKYELPNRLRELLTLPPALESPCAVALASIARLEAAVEVFTEIGTRWCEL